MWILSSFRLEIQVEYQLSNIGTSRDVLKIRKPFVYCNGIVWYTEREYQNIARGTTDPGYWLFNLSYLSS